MPLQNAFTLSANAIYTSLANMIISQEVFADNLGSHQTLVDKARVDGGLLGDRKLYYATDVLKSHDWLNDAEAANLLAIERPIDPAVQSIVLDQFKQIRLTTDNYLSKQAFATEGAFSSFNAVMLGWLRETKRVYDGTTYNVFVGNAVSNIGKQTITVDLGTGSGHPLYNLTGVEKEQMEAILIAQKMADLFVEMADYSRDFNDYGYMRSYANEDIKVIWNSKYINKIRKVDLTIFHKDGLIDKFEGDRLPASYFGRAVASGDKGSGKAIGTDGTYDNTKGVILRSKVEKDIGNGSGKASAGTAAQHVFPGQLIPNGVTVKANGDFEESEVYVEDPSVICKVLVKLPPYMSAFEVGTTFFNPRSLTENHYLTFGHNTLQYFKNYPMITIKASV